MARRGATMFSVAFLLALGVTDGVSDVLAADPEAPVVQPGAWSPVGGSNAINDDVYALSGGNNDVLVGGDFYNAGGIGTADDLVRWDGAAWTGVGSHGGNGAFSVSPSIRAIARDGQDMYVGGTFQNAFGDNSADRIAFWDDSAGTWNHLGSGLNGAVNAIVINGANVYVGGEFTDAGGVAEADYVAKWNGWNWSALGAAGNPSNGALADHVNALALKNGTLFAGGLFTNADGNQLADYFAKWDGTSWVNLGANPAGTNGALGAEVYALLVSGPDIYVGGTFSNAAGVGAAEHIAKWGASTWSALGPSTLNNTVYALAGSGSDIYAGGMFVDAGGPMDNLARFDGSTWSAVGDNGAGNGALNNTVRALAVFGSDLYVGGFFTDAGGNVNADYLAAWGLPPVLQPDGRVRLGSAGGYTGNNIYNLNGKNQKKSGSGARGTTVTYEISVQNDSATDSDAVSLDDSGAATADFTIKYFDGATDITTDVGTGAYQTPVLAAGATYTIRVEIKVKNSAPVGAKVTRTVTLTSAGDASKQDAVKVVANRI